MDRFRPLTLVHGATLVVAVSIALSAQSRPGNDADRGVSLTGDQIAERLGEKVEQYLSVARRVSAREDVVLQRLTGDLAPTGNARRLEYDTRVEWEPDQGGGVPSASVFRQLRSIDGRKPRAGDDEGCLAERTTEPLALLLPSQRGLFTFAFGEAGRSGRRVPRLSYIPTEAGVPSITWRGECGSFDLPGMLRGEITYDPDTFAVLTLTQRLTSSRDMVVPKEQRRDDWGSTIRLERIDATMTWAAVKFREPDETLMLPITVERVTVIRTPRVQAVRVSQRFSRYTRFVTGARVVPVP